MAGFGRKVFTRERATVADVQGYLMDQVVMRFPSASAANAAVPSPSEGMHRYLDDVNRTEFHNGSGWFPVGPLLSEPYGSTFGSGLTVVSGGAAQTGITSGLASLANLVLPRAGRVTLLNPGVRWNPGGQGVMRVYLNGIEAGQAVSGAGETTDTLLDIGFDLSAGSHVVSARWEATSGSLFVARYAFRFLIGFK